MDETAVRTKPDWLNNRVKAAGERIDDAVAVAGDDFDEVEDEEDECDEEAWDTLSRSFLQAQTVLDENRVLIDEVNSNHESKIPDNMAKNVGLIRQINGNISKVLSIYSDLSINFSNIVHQHRASATVNPANRDGDKLENSVDDSAEHVPEKSEMVELMAARLDIPTLSPRSYEVFMPMFDFVFSRLLLFFTVLREALWTWKTGKGEIEPMTS